MDSKNKNDLSGSFVSEYLPTDELLYGLKDRALASAAEGVVISDPSLPDNPIIYVNSGFEAMTGYAADEVLGKNCRFLQGPATGSEASEEIRRAICQDRPCVVELLNYRKDGSTFWNRLSMTPVRDDHGKTTHYIGVQSDITRRREAEDSLRRANMRLEAANNQMKRALNYAAGIQHLLLPAEPLKGDRYQVVSRLTACEELAGDTLNYFALDDRRVGFYVLDVVGHGVSAALMSVAISRLLSPRSGKSCLFESVGPDQKAARVLSPAQVGRLLNEIFSENIGTGQFFTIFYGIWDASNDTLNYFSAGHPEAVFLPADGSARLLEATGFPIGVCSEPGYAELTIKLGRGDRLFVYSDGLTEAMNERKEPFGVEGLVAIAQAHRDVPLDTCTDAIMTQAERFRAAAPPQDDLSLLAFEVTV